MEKLEEEVYIEKPKEFSLIKEGDMVFKFKKSLYKLKKENRTYYAMLDKQLAKLGFAKGIVDGNLYLKEIENVLLIIVIFLNDIIFGVTMRQVKNLLMK